MTESEEFDLLLKEKYHKEQMSLLKSIVESLDNQKVQDIEGALRNFATVLTNITKQEVPKVNVISNQDKVIESVDKMSEEITKELVNLQSSKEWVFKVEERDSQGFIRIITAKAK